MKTSHCTSCGAAVIWTSTRNGKSMPVDAQPSTRGNLALTEWPIPDSSDTKILAEHLTAGQAAGMRASGRPTYLSHFADCPDATQHRRQ